MKSELSLDTSDPDVQAFLAECKPGDEIIVRVTTDSHEGGTISGTVNSAEYDETSDEEPEAEEKEYGGKGKMPKGLMIVVGAKK